MIEAIHRREKCKNENFAYERIIKSLFEAEIGWKPTIIDAAELDAMLKTYQEDQRYLTDALVGLRRVWELRNQGALMMAELKKRQEENQKG